MPNHVHFIIGISGGSRPTPTLGMIVGFIKSESTKHIHRVEATRGSPSNNEVIWQRNYYEHIIRNEKEYASIKQYIQLNPCSWQNDELFV